LAAYDAAAWYGTDAVQALKPPTGAVHMYIGSKTDAGWVIGFGALNPDKTRFLLAYEAVPGSDVKHPTVKVHEPALEDSGVWLHEAVAFETTRQKLGKLSRPYNLAVLPAPGNHWFVYAYPAQTDLTAFPTGGDTRYLLSTDGDTIEETHRMHASILENKLDASQQAKMSFHTAFLDDAPEDTDVSNVLMMGKVPMLIVTNNFAYQISPNGTITYLGTKKDFLKNLAK
jgi:hypothetical protein